MRGRPRCGAGPCAGSGEERPAERHRSSPPPPRGPPRRAGGRRPGSSRVAVTAFAGPDSPARLSPPQLPPRPPGGGGSWARRAARALTEHHRPRSGSPPSSPDPWSRGAAPCPLRGRRADPPTRTDTYRHTHTSSYRPPRRARRLWRPFADELHEGPVKPGAPGSRE